MEGHPQENPYTDPTPKIIEELISTMGVSPNAGEPADEAVPPTEREAQQTPSIEPLYDVRPGGACVEMVTLPDGTQAVSRLVLGLPQGEIKRAQLLDYPAFLAIELALRDAELWAASRVGRLLSIFGVKTDDQAKKLNATHQDLIFVSWLASKDESPYVEVRDPAKAQLLYEAIQQGFGVFVDHRALHGEDPAELRAKLDPFLKHVPAAKTEG